MDQRKEELNRNFCRVKEEIKQSCQACERDPEDLTLVAVSKYHPAEDIALAEELGQLDFGENRVQEWKAKEEALQENDQLRWHLIGTLQRNKVKDVVGRVCLIHSVSSLSLVQKLQQQADRFDVQQDILLQVNLAREESKHGFASQASYEEALAYLASCPRLHLRGLMCMAPAYEDPAQAGPLFEQCYELYRKLQVQYGAENIHVLSMGMSQDFPEAIKAGATHIRIGTAFFGPRDYGNPA